MEPNHPLAVPHRVIARAAAVIGLLGIALVHLLDLPGKIHETPYLAVAYGVLIVGCVTAAGALVHRDDRRAWLSATVLSLATIIGYAVNRTVGMPAAMDDIGNWLEPLGLASLFIEAVTAAVGVYALSFTAPQVGAAARESTRRELRSA